MRERTHREELGRHVGGRPSGDHAGGGQAKVDQLAATRDVIHDNVLRLDVPVNHRDFERVEVFQRLRHIGRALQPPEVIEALRGLMQQLVQRGTAELHDDAELRRDQRRPYQADDVRMVALAHHLNLTSILLPATTDKLSKRTQKSQATADCLCTYARSSLGSSCVSLTATGFPCHSAR